MKRRNHYLRLGFLPTTRYLSRHSRYMTYLSNKFMETALRLFSINSPSNF